MNKQIRRILATTAYGLTRQTCMRLTDDELKAAMRFCETCEDGEGYDVPKPLMKRLAELGLVVYAHFGRYAGTPLLDRLQVEHATGVWDEFQLVSA